MGRVRASRKGCGLWVPWALSLPLWSRAGCWPGVRRRLRRPRTKHSATGPKVVAVGAENEYANVISQVGGPYVSVTAIMSNPNTDPHEFEASARVAVQVSEAQLIVQNGVGYDSFMDKIEGAVHRSGRQVIVVQHLLGLSSSIFNPHLWYDPRTMPAVADAVASDLSRLQPAHRAIFQANARRFDDSLRPWLSAIASFKSAHPGTPVAVTEPVADYMLEAVGARHPDATFSAGGHHERYGPLAPGHLDRRKPDQSAQGQGSAVQRASHRQPHELRSWPMRRRRECPLSPCTRQCRSPATTTSPGCWLRSRPSRGRWLEGRRRKGCDGVAGRSQPGAGRADGRPRGPRAGPSGRWALRPAGRPGDPPRRDLRGRRRGGDRASSV